MGADGRAVSRGDQGGRFRYRRLVELVPGVSGNEDLPDDEQGAGHGRHLLDLRGDHGDRYRVHVLPRAGDQGEVLAGDPGGAAERCATESKRLNLLALGVALVSLRENDVPPCARDFFVIICKTANAFVA